MGLVGLDYLVIGATLVVSLGIGLYQGATGGGKGQGQAQFLTGGGNMSWLPVSLSMLASFLSSITLLGQPAEIYLYGPQQWLFGIAGFLAAPIVSSLMIPFFRSNNYYSAYQYFGERFSRGLQLLASLLFTFQMVAYLGLVMYAPALAIHQVTGLDTLSVVSVMYIVCIFYTTLGGMRAVVWTDSFQVLVLTTAMIGVMVKGSLDLGGVTAVWQVNAARGRTNFFRWSLDPRERYTVWSSLFGAAALHAATYGANQLQVQRYLVVDSVRSARRMLWLNMLGWSVVVGMTTYTGLLLFAAYADRDPLASKRISKPDQLLPLFVMETLGDYPGFPGLFVSGIFSAGLSTVSTGVNSLAAIWYAELWGSRHLDKQASTAASATPIQGGEGGGGGGGGKGNPLTVNLLALSAGLLSYSVVFLVPYMGNLLPMAVSLSGVFNGALFGLFLLGMLFPWANTAGGSSGLIAGITLLGWIALSARHQPPLGDSEGEVERQGSFLENVSYMWYCPAAVVCTLVVGLAGSWLFRGKGPPPVARPPPLDPALNAALLNPQSV